MNDLGEEGEGNELSQKLDSKGEKDLKRELRRNSDRVRQ
jgi:hypothetical protein